MGIPMFREPSPEASKNNTNKDPSALARSTIRRHASIRRSLRNNASASALRGASLRSPFSHTIANQIEHTIANEIESEAHGLPRGIRSPIPNLGPREDPLDLIARAPEILLGIRDVGQRSLHDAIRHGGPGQSLRFPQHPTLSELSRRPLRGDGPSSGQPSGHPAYTPGFAPAVAYHRGLSPPPQTRPSLSPFPPDGFEVVRANVPSLRRSGQRSINDANSSANRDLTMDGLGDRQRSITPDDYHANEAWETLLTTIAPDDNLPSADSSFASGSAPGTNTSTNARSRNPASSFQTFPSSTATVQMAFEPYPEYVNPCDYPSSTDPDSEPEDVLDQISMMIRYQRRMRQMGFGGRPNDVHSTMSSHPPVPRTSLPFSNSSPDPELRQMQAILDRLARRENVPDNWWAAAGLSTISDRSGANNGSDDSENRDDTTIRM